MKYFIILFSVLLVGCSSTNKLSKLDNKTTINGGNELIKIQSQICNEFKSEDKYFIRVVVDIVLISI